MTRYIIMNSFISGEIDRSFYARTDLQKYGSGVALARNFTIDFRGGLKSRPGFSFVSSLAGPTVLFSFSRGEKQHPYIILLQAQILKIWDGSTFLVDEFVTPYSESDLSTLKAYFWLNRLVITSTEYPPHQLIFDESGFSFRSLEFVEILDYPTSYTFTTYRIDGSGATRSSVVASGNAKTVYAISAVYPDGRESMAAEIEIAEGCFNYTVEAGFGEISWAAVAGASSYKVYRSVMLEGELDKAAALGFLGETKLTTFTDNNYVVDFSQPPKQAFNPFANKSVLEVEVTTPGFGFVTKSPTVTVTSAAGAGLKLLPVIRGGAVVRVLLFYGGEGYEVGDTIDIANPDGPAAVAKVTKVTPATGNNPAVSVISQQRQYFAGTENLPLTFNASRIGDYLDFSAYSPPAPDDAFAYSVDAEDISPIKHLVKARQSIIIMHAQGVDRLLSQGAEAMGPTNRKVENQASIGVGDATPVLINDDVIFGTRYGTSIISMAYTFYTNAYTPQDVSVLAPHLLQGGGAVKRFAWLQEPDKLLWVLLEDGRLLTLTYMKEQEVFAWSQHKTAGTVLDIVAVNTPERPVLYAVIERAWGVQFEKLENRAVENLVDYVAVDSAIVVEEATATNTITGLDIFNGQTVSILADGDAVLDVAVAGGEATIPFAANKFIVGLPFVCDALTLPLSNPEIIQQGVRGRIVGLAARLQETRGLEVGADSRAVYEMKDRGFEDWGEITGLRTDHTYMRLAANWTRDSQITFRQKYPLPAHVVGFVVDLEVEK